MTHPTADIRPDRPPQGALRRAAREEERLAALIAMVAGIVDAYGFITYGTYLSFMSGNTTQAGYRTAQGDFAAAAPALTAIASFAGGSFAGAFTAPLGAFRMHRFVFVLAAALLVSVIGLTGLGLLSANAHIALITFPMGLMNTVLTRVGAQSVSLTFVTGTLSRFAQQLAWTVRRAPLADSQGAWDTHWRRTVLLFGIWAAFLAGAFFSGIATPRLGTWVLAIPAAILSVLAAFGRSNEKVRLR
ncbi:MAG: YoaK family protein [Rhizomicrobium sp.]